MRKIAFLLTFVLAIAAVVLAKDNQLGVNRTKTVKFAQEALVGGQVLPAGTYRVTHVMEGADHIMVFKSDTVETRVKCNMVPLPEKSHQTYYEFRTNEQGARVLQAMVFSGDNFRHELIE